MSDTIYVGELPIGTEVRIIATIRNNEEVTLTTEVIDNSKDLGTLYIKPLKNKEGKYYSFKGLKTKASAVLDGKIYFFPLSEVAIVLHKGKHIHALVCKIAQKPTNRRENIRVRISSAAALAPIKKKVTGEAYVFDVSRTGIGINVRGQCELEKGDEVIVAFKYRVGKVSETYKVATKVAHAEYNKQNNFTKIGLQFLKEYPKVNELVTYVQREELKKLTHDRDE